MAVTKVYLITEKGIEVRWGADAADIIAQIEANPRPYSYREEDGSEVYLAVLDHSLRPLEFPAPEDYGTTSAELYAKAVTCADLVAQVIELQSKTKGGFFAGLKGTLTPILGIAALAFVIMIMAVALKG